MGDGSYKNISDGTANDVVRVTLQAGTDIDCGSTMNQANVARALLDGNITQDLLDARLTNLLKTQMRLGWYNQPGTLPPQWVNLTRENAVDTPAHRQLALEAAEQGVTLLKLQGHILPLDAGRLRTLAVIGSAATFTKELQGNYAGSAPFLPISPLKGIQTFSVGQFSVVFEAGCFMDSNATDAANFSAAEAAATTADATVLVVGADQLRGGAEGNDRGGQYFPADPKSKADHSIGLPAPQDALVAAVAAAAKGKPVIVVVISGESLDLGAIDAVGAIMWSGYPSQSGGTALANAIFGLYNPSGRLPITFYKTGYAALVSEQDMGMRPNKTTGNPGRTSRFYSGREVAYPAFTGLSYTNFSTVAADDGVPNVHQLSHAELTAELMAAKGQLGPVHATRTVNVTNIGSLAGAYSLCALSAHQGTERVDVRSKKW